MRSEWRLLLLALLAGLLGAQCGGSPERALPEPPRKEGAKTTLLEARAGVRVAEDLPGPQPRIFAIDLPADRFVLVVVEQRQADVIVTASGPAGDPPVKIDTPIDDQGVEVLPLVTSAGGRHQLAVRRGGEPGKGGFALRIEAIRPVEDPDRFRATAARLDAEAVELSDPAAAEALYRRALDAWRKSEDRRGEGITWWRLGLLLRSRNPEEAIRCYEEALRLARSLGDGYQEVRLLNLLGLVHKRREDWSRAESFFRSAQAAAGAYGDPAGEGISLSNLASLAQSREQLARAVELYDAALDLLRLHAQPGELSFALHNVGTLYLQLNRLEEARDHLRHALLLRQDLGNRYDEASTLLALGQAHAWQGEIDRAFPYIRRAAHLLRERGDRLEAIALERLGTLHLEKDQLAEAGSAFRRAADLFGRLGGTDSFLGWNLIDQGRLQQAHGEPGNALALYQRAQQRLAGDRTGEAAALYSQAAVLRALEDRTGALERVERAVQILETLRADAPAFSLQSGYLAPRRIYWELWIDLLMEAGEPVRALEASERNRARSFLETLAASPGEIRRDAPADLLALEAGLTGRINAVEQALRERATAPARREILERDLRNLLLDYDKLQARLRKAPQRAAPRPLQAREIQETLDEDTLLLVYALGSARSFLWAVDRRSVRSYVLPARDEIEAPAHEAWEMLSFTTPRKRKYMRTTLAELGDMLLKPLAEDPEVELGTRRLAIVAEGALRDLPFAALPVPGQSDPDHPRYLIEDHEIVYLDSPSVLALLRARFADRPHPPREVAALADPVYSLDDVRLTGPAATRGNPLSEGDLERLPATRREAEVLASLVPRGQILTALDFAAHRELLLNGSLRDYRILHLAAHGFLHPRPELSGLVLSRVDARRKPRDGHVRAYELFDLDLPADLVVLSACRTLPDPQAGGEGLMAMPRGFMVAGAPRVVVSLWEVADDSTADLMEVFYRGLFERKLRPAAALREAQIALLRSGRLKDPYSWAPFIFQGEWR